MISWNFPCDTTSIKCRQSNKKVENYMNKLFTYAIICILLLMAMCLPAIAAEEAPVPKLFVVEPEPVVTMTEPMPTLYTEGPEIARSNDEIMRGYFVSYENDILIIVLQETEEEVILIDKDGALVEFFEQTEPRDFIEIAVNRSEILTVTAFLGRSHRTEGPVVTSSSGEVYAFYLG